MMSMSGCLSLFVLALLGVVDISLAHFSECPGSQSFKITNLSLKQNLTEPIIIVHDTEVELFGFDAVATDILAAYSMDGDNTAIIEALQTDEYLPYICGYTVLELPLGPGESIYANVEVDDTNCTCSHIAATILTRVAWTNDGFTGISKVTLPVAEWSTLSADHASWIEMFTPAYDSGAEANTELCVDMGGCDDTIVPTIEVASDAADLIGEGFIRVHTGIMGVGDLDPTLYSWSNPIAYIQLHGRLPEGITEEDLPISMTEYEFYAATADVTTDSSSSTLTVATSCFIALTASIVHYFL